MAIAVLKPLIPVSIVIPTYNHVEYLRECLKSIVETTDLGRVEIVVVANGCRDGSEAMAKEFPRVVVLSYPEPLGFPKAVNAGIEASRGEHVVLLNDDTKLLSQERHRWIDMLLEPFKDPEVGLTGPVKFSWDCGGIQREALAFWCVMISRRALAAVGPLDEAFSPGNGEDGDYCIRAERAGFKLVQVPHDSVAPFGQGIPNQIFPIYHRGSGTFGERDYKAVIERNSKLLAERYGKDSLDEIFAGCLAHPCDTNQLFPVLRRYAQQCRHVTEFGTRGVFTTWALLAARPRRVVSYDIEYGFNAPAIAHAAREASKAGISFEFVHKDDLQADIEPTEFLFIDTKHTYAQLREELARHAPKVSRYIAIHDTESYGVKGEDGGPGELQAIDEFLRANPEWTAKEHIKESNGLTVLERRVINVSIVIPTCGKDWEHVLKPCVELVMTYTDLADKEIIVVPNGAPNEVIEWLALRPEVGVRLAFEERIGYIRAVNAGIRLAKGQHVITFDDDCFLMPQPKDFWINALKEPFKDEAVAASGPFSTVYGDEIGHVLHSGCTMYRRDVLDKLGGFDEAFNPGYMGDEDLSVRIRKGGYKLAAVPPGGPREYANGMFVLEFPVMHLGTVATMPKHTTDLPLVKANRELLYRRHAHKGPKVSIIIPTFNHLEDLLKPNLKSLAEQTDLVGRSVEVIVVANGCRDGTEEYVKSLGEPYRVISFPDALGYTRATNEGIKVARGEHLILFNNDNELLPQPKNQWLDWLLEPFKDPKVGITGPLQLHDDYADEDVIIGFCLCVSAKVLREVMVDTGGLLDEIFSPGGGEDIDLCCKVRRAGYAVRQVPRDGKLGFSNTNTGEFMIWHKNNQTFKDIPEYTNWYVKRNGLINLKRYNKNIRLNLGSGGIEYKGYLSVDLYDKRAAILMDATKLDFDDNSVTELLALHLFEHLNPYRVNDILREWLRVLKPGGRLIMEMPDIEKLCERFVAAKTDEYPKERYGILNAVYGSVNTTDQGDPGDITAPHLFGWWPQSIRDHLLGAGFEGVMFGPEQFPHPESNMHVEAVKPGGTPMARSVAGLWNYSDQQFPYGDDTTYKLAAELLKECKTVEDWGCGTAYAKRFFGPDVVYKGLDGSRSKFCDAVVDLVTYRSDPKPDGILIRHVLEHNFDWKRILENAAQSFRKRLVVVIFTPFSRETKQIATNWGGIPDLSFRESDLVDCWRERADRWSLRTFATQTQYGVETVFCVEREGA